MPSFSVLEQKYDTIFLQKFKWRMSIPVLFDSKSLYLKSFKPPSIKIGVEEVKGVSVVYSFAKEAKFDDISVVFYETKDTLKKLIDWSGRVYDYDKGLIMAPSNYLTKTEFEQLDDSCTNWEYKITAFNTFPKSIDFEAGDYSANGVKLITMTLACSHIKIDFRSR